MLRPRRPLHVLAAILALALAAPAAQRVPISFADYHGYTGTVKYMKDIAAAYPDITELREIGKSGLGRPIYVLVVTNRGTGAVLDRFVELRHPRDLEVKGPFRETPDLGKPGQWIDGGLHGNEYTGTEVALYIIDKLVSGYGSDPALTKLVDGRVIYICPVANPDGVYNSVEREISQRGNGDLGALPNAPRDLNGDGHITQFRTKDPRGAYVQDDKDPRLMIRLGANEQTAKPRYSVLTEGTAAVDAPRGGGEDPAGSIDVNRNFPEGWWTDDGLPGGTGTYPTSSPEARAIVEFAVTHRNILMVQNFHTSGGFTYRVPGTAPDTAMSPRDVAVYDLVLGKKYLEILGEKVPEAWQKPELLPDLRAKLRAAGKNKYAADRGYEMPRAWIMGYNEDRDARYGFGMVIDWWYQQYGAFATTTELWNPDADIPGFPVLDAQSPDARNERERALLKYNDAKYGGRLFAAWTPFTHPALGAGEIGGWIPKYRGNALPGEPLLGVCEKHWQFELFRAGLLPDVVISDASARVVAMADNAAGARASVQGDKATITRAGAKGKYRVVEVTATIENRGPLATHVARGEQLRGNREDVAWLVGDRDKVKFLQGTPHIGLGVLDGTLRIPSPSGGAGPNAPGQRGGGAPPQGRTGAPPAGQRGLGARGGDAAGPAQTGPRREVRWLVAVEGDSPLKVIVTSQKGGTAVKDLTVK